MLKKHLLLIPVFAVISSFAFAQTDRGQLERERQEIQNELRQIQSVYDQLKSKKKTSVGQLNMVKRKIALQERLIGSINKEIKSIDDEIYLSNLEIYRLSKLLDTQRVEYAKSVVYAYKNRSNYDYINFVFSATSFNDALRRISYLKSYRSYREKQVNTILETQQLIARKQAQQLGRKQQKSQVLQSEVKERNVLDVQRKEKDAVVTDLKSQEKDLQKQIAAKKKRDREIQNAIAAIVRREIAAAKKEAERKAAEARKADVAASPTPGNPATITTRPVTRKSTSYLDLNAADVALNSKFENNRGKLPWPVDNGFVKVGFGNYTIEGTNLKNNNPGLTIGTPNAGVAVKAVFDGEVAAVHNYGDGVAVVIRHGKYFTSYSNLSGVSVSKGAIVKTGQVIGRAGDSEDGAGGQVDFMLMIETNNVNPAAWLR